ncbi:MAG: hypothetical protein ACI9U2_001758 [Bradymonadia bacterium]
MRRSKTTEATMNLRKIFDSSVSYFASEHASRVGGILAKQFPVAIASTPAATACPDKHAPQPDTFADVTWQALNFSVDDPFYYQYQYDSTGIGATGIDSAFTARSLGDLNCDGTLSTFERFGDVDAELNVNGGAGIFKNQPLE